MMTRKLLILMTLILKKKMKKMNLSDYYCPICAANQWICRACKLICGACGYMEDCSDIGGMPDQEGDLVDFQIRD